MELITQPIRVLVASLSDKDYWLKKLKDKFGLIVQMPLDVQNGYWILRQIYQILESIPEALVRNCRLKYIVLRSDMGPNRSDGKYPNHGYFVGSQIALNIDMFIHPDQPEDFFNEKNYFLTRQQQTLIHEAGHAYDHHNPINGKDLSAQEDWMRLSGWSKEYKPGFKKLIINEPGTPKVIGEMYYSPTAEFTRSYASRNNWDDWADSFSYYVAGMPDKVPSIKRAYFDRILKKYY